LVAFSIGLLTMLPDDLENLSQSVVASNFFANNILLELTTGNYWNVLNDYKPLMHTWSLGIEEQYYLIYPPLLIILQRRSPALVLPVLCGLACVSLGAYLLPFPDHLKFFMLPFRFFELAAGGIAGLLLRGRMLSPRVGLGSLLVIAVLLLLPTPLISGPLRVISTVFLSAILLTSSNHGVTAAVLTNRLSVYLGRISFSLYMWHQVLLAYGRYFVFRELRAPQLGLIFVATVLLSMITYRLIEEPFRRPHYIKLRTLAVALGLGYFGTMSGALFVYLRAGVIRDVPELDLQAGHATRGMHELYNTSGRFHDRDFIADDRVRVLVVGRSFSRDWINVLKESRFQDELQISYLASYPQQGEVISSRFEEADVIFLAIPSVGQAARLSEFVSKTYVIGVKNFGDSNGFYYNYSGPDYYKQRATVAPRVRSQNARAAEIWGDRYFNCLNAVIDDSGQVPVFTPSKKFISQDTRHFTQPGARYFAELMDSQIAEAVRVQRRGAIHVPGDSHRQP
jgi:Acyltransferase family